MDKSLWGEKFPASRIPRFPCPACSNRSLSNPLIADLSTLVVEEFSLLFHLFLRCAVASCQQAVSVCGQVELQNAKTTGLDDMILYPEFFSPAPPIIINPPAQGGMTGLLVEKSFVLFWIDLSSCVNCLRTCVERILDDFYVPANCLPLPKRIQEFKKNATAIPADDRKLVERIFEAIRKIGNLGSHGEEIERQKVLEAYYDFESALQILYGSGHSVAIARIKARSKR